MNKQELIEAVFKLPVDASGPRPKIDHLTTLELIKLLDEPQKVVVPQFVAEHIEWTKEEDFHLLGAMNRENFDKKLEDWFYTDDNMELFARAWLDGYEEVEEEKRYTVSLKNGQPLTKTKSGKAIYFNQDIITGNYKFTRKELEEAGFGEVFNSPLFEVKEVEE